MVSSLSYALHSHLLKPFGLDSKGKYSSICLSVQPSTSLGQQFATIEAITVTLTLLQHFVFELVDPDKEPAYQQALTLPMAHGLHVRIKRRRGCQLQHVGS